MNARTLGFPGGHCPEHHSASASLSSYHSPTVPYLSKVNSAYARSHSHNVKENVIDQTRPSTAYWEHLIKPLEMFWPSYLAIIRVAQIFTSAHFSIFQHISLIYLTPGHAPRSSILFTSPVSEGDLYTPMSCGSLKYKGINCPALTGATKMK